MLRTIETYYEKTSTLAPGTQIGIKQVVNSFFSYCMEKGIGDPIPFMKKSENDCFDLLQDWINWNTNRGLAASTIRQNFSSLKGFLYYVGIKIVKEDVKANLSFPKQLKEEPFPLQLDAVRQILEQTTKKKALYLTLLSSGLRIGEAVQLRRKDFDFSKERVMIHIPAKITKTKTARTTFISREAASLLSIKIRNLAENDLVFGSNEKVHAARMNEVVNFERFLKKADLDQKYDGINRRKITLHSFRAFFFTKAARIHDENYAHKLTGHGGYLPQYDRLTDEEKLELYITLEPELLVYDQSKKNAEIEKLKKEKSELEKRETEVDNLKENMDKIIEEKIGQYNQKFMENLEKMYDEQILASEKRLDAMDRAFEKKLDEIDKN
ncbi:MAG: tyrosine-type recombinase/integrase [Thaumarchaeota archaeon]|nr:tyrosine-type recombinase/integrase [Nitrososphaerota archaeon]